MRFKKAFFILSIVLLGAGFVIASLAWQQRKDSDVSVVALQKRLEDIETKAREKQMGDVQGGRTPRETLRSYIAALERRDFDSASRYLVEERRTEEVRQLRALAQAGNLEEFIAIIKKAEDDFISEDLVRLKASTSFDPPYLIRFIRYPNGIWKIAEI